MIDTVLWIAVLAAMVGAALRNVTAMVLLASFALSMALCRFGVEFNAAVWMCIDTAAAVLIIRKGMKRRDWAVVAMFLPAWALYVAWPEWTPKAVTLIVAGQMLLTFPVRRISTATIRRSIRLHPNWTPWDKLDARAHA